MPIKMHLKRPYSGNAIAELPLVLLVLVIIIALPFINLVSSSVRTYFVREGVLNAVRKAARCETMLANPMYQNNALSADNTFRSDMTSYFTRGGFSGITVTNQQLWVVAEPLVAGPNTPPRQQNCTNQAWTQGIIDTKNYTYWLEGRVQAKVSPLIPMPGAMVPQVPGLSCDSVVDIRVRQMSENPDGLTS